MRGHSKRSLGVACLALFGAAATSAAAWPADPAPPPPGASPIVVRAWIAANLDETGYAEILTVGTTVVLLVDPATLRVQPDGHLVGVFRSELFSPLEKNGHLIRSARKTFEIDCGAPSYRELHVEEFAGSNLQNPIAKPSPAAGWTQPLAETTSAGQSIRYACALANAKRP